MVPHLVTALTGPINELEQRILESMPAIERWFRLEWMEHTPPFYTSVDIRNAGFKLAPVGALGVCSRAGLRNQGSTPNPSLQFTAIASRRPLWFRISSPP